MFKTKFYPDLSVNGVGATQKMSGVSGPNPNPKNESDISVFQDMAGGNTKITQYALPANGLSIRREKENGNDVAFVVFRFTNQDGKDESKCVKLTDMDAKTGSFKKMQIMNSDGSYETKELGNSGTQRFDFNNFINNMGKKENPTRELASMLGFTSLGSTQDHITLEETYEGVKTTTVITEEKTDNNSKSVIRTTDANKNGVIDSDEKVYLAEYDEKGRLRPGGEGPARELRFEDIDINEMRTQGNAKTFKEWWDNIRGFNNPQ